MSTIADSAGPAPRSLPRFERIAPALFLAAAIALYAGIALGTGQPQYLSLDNWANVLGRSIALGITALGQTFAILVASIDLSVANLISAAAVLASFIMNGDPAMMLPATLAVLALGLVVGLANGLVVTKLGVNPLIATLAMALVIQGVLSAFFTNFAGAVPAEFQFFAYGTVAGLPFSLLFLSAL
ncbi:MAG: ABC transporter permease, partial [Rhizobiales bacterium]|nr:ABC transporter permease [Hyphomicrobiales bacterium]